MKSKSNKPAKRVKPVRRAAQISNVAKAVKIADKIVAENTADKWGVRLAEKKPDAPSMRDVCGATQFVGPFALNAVSILNGAATHIVHKHELRDAPNGERSMARTVAAFNAVTGHAINERDGWLFMVILKMSRATVGGYNADDFEDGSAYFALAGEKASRDAMDLALAKFHSAQEAANG